MNFIKKLLIKRFQYCSYVVERLRKMETSDIEQRIITGNRFSRYAKMSRELKDYDRLMRFVFIRRLLIENPDRLAIPYATEVLFRNKMAKKIHA